MVTNLKSAIPNRKWIHLTTLSARASTFGGIVRPICFAVLRLIMNSNFVGCSMGSSLGLVPFKNLVDVVERYLQVLRLARAVGHEPAIIHIW